MTAPSFSFEFFPAKTPHGDDSLWDQMQILAKLGPRYMTVTYGAGGSTKDGTLKTLRRAIEHLGIPMASHLTFLSTTKADLDTYIDSLWDSGVKHIVALRGDLPAGKNFSDFAGPDYYKFTSEFVETILQHRPFEISVAAYPEKHPDAPSMDADLEALRLKCEAGATRAITQFFFNNDVYYKFLDRVEQTGIQTPICPGLLPVHDFVSMVKFAQKCQAHVPDWLHEKFEGLENNPEEAKKVATDILVNQTRDLAENGIKHIHFYTLNKSDITSHACEILKGI